MPDFVRPEISLFGIIGYAVLAFVLVLALTPWFVNFLRRNRVGKQLRVQAMDGRDATIFRTYHKDKHGTPTMGGILMWGGIVVTCIISRILASLNLVDHSILQRKEVYLPLFVLVSMGLLGAMDDYLNIIGTDEAKVQRVLKIVKWVSALASLILIPLGLYIFVPYLRAQGAITGMSSQLGMLSVIVWYALFILGLAVIALSGLALDDLVRRILLGGAKKGGLGAMPKIITLIVLSAIGALWFYFKLDRSSFFIPYIGDVSLGLWFIPIFMFILVGTANAVNFTDGLDGLAGGLLTISFLAYAVLAYFHVPQLTFLAAFCAVCIGAIAAFLWHNVPPALFFMGDTGSMALGGTLAVIAMMIDQVAVLPLIGFIFVVEMLSVIIQLTSKKLRGGKKVFRCAPIHHHFEALEWGESKVTMRFWIIGSFTAVLGVILGLAH